MIDKAAYIGSTGAKNSMRRLAVITNNLANANTVGFRADLDAMKAFHKDASSKLKSRDFATFEGTFSNFKIGPVLSTGRDLDISVDGPGFIAVQNASGQEGYTRAGNLNLRQDGFLVTASGDMVLGNGGPISLPPVEKISIGTDGTISVRMPGTQDMVTINRLKLTDPDLHGLHKGHDGLFYMQEGEVAPLSESTHLVPRSLEGSNVNPIETLTQIIDLSRNYEVHTKLLKTMADNSSKANQMLSISS
ncbi:MAG: flagellar basal body rod protein FlgF [Gammaproteobacteria bacterium]